MECKNNLMRFIFINLFFLFSFFVISANVYAIDVNNNPAVCSDTPQESQPYCTIQAAINAASSGNVITIAPGTYAQNVIITNKERITIQGVGDSTVVEPSSGIGFSIKDSNNLTIKNLK